MASGRACGTSNKPMYQKNCARTSMLNPFPMRSSIYLQRNCIISTNWQMKKVPMKRSPNCLAINMSNFLILSISFVIVSCPSRFFATGINSFSVQSYTKKSENLYFSLFLLYNRCDGNSLRGKKQKKIFFLKFSSEKFGGIKILLYLCTRN